MRIAPSLCLAAIALGGWSAAPPDLEGQRAQTGTLTGQVVDEGTRASVEGARIVLEGLGRAGVSNELGRFAFSEVPAGWTRLRVERIGYAATVGEVEIKVGEVAEARLLLSTQAVPLEPIIVTARRRETVLPAVEGFGDRYYSGRGRFVLEAEIRQRNPTKLVEVLRETGLEVTGNGTSVKLSRENCAPAVFVDGIKVTHPQLIRSRAEGVSAGLWPDPTASADQDAAHGIGLVHPSSVQAVEIYRSALETPAQFLELNRRCGAVVIWTKRGAAMGEGDPVPLEVGKGGSRERALIAVAFAAVAVLAHAIF